LYREQIADDPAEALGERFERLLDTPLDTHLLADVAEWRFRAAAQLRRWDVLAEDVRKLRPRFGPGEDRQWLPLVFSLADRLAWIEDSEAADLLEVCREEVIRHEYLAPSLSHAFDRFDLLLTASAGWRTLWTKSRVPDKLLRLIAASWAVPFEEVRPLLTEVLGAIAAAPQRWLEHLDDVREGAPSTLSLFGDLLDQLELVQESGTAPSPDHEVLTGLVMGFLSRRNVADYANQRSPILAFCLRESVAPEEMAEVASEFTGAWKEVGGAWFQALTTDWPLRYVYRAHRLFWA
jgi:hypothetical protein